MRLIAAPQVVAQRPWPKWPAGWSVMARSNQLSRPRTVNFAGREIVLFRGEDGVARAVDAWCPHMGAHLGQSRVKGITLRCALHHREVGCERSPWKVEERFGLVFVTMKQHVGPLPDVANRDDFHFTTSAPVEIDVPWANFVLNGFDLPHLEAVHHRALLAPPTIRHDAGCMRLEYETRITGRGPSDLMMKLLSRNHVRARMSCFGTVGVVEANLGWTRSVLICGVSPKTETQGNEAWPTGHSRTWLSFGVPKNSLTPRLRAAVTKWLYLAFLSRDFVVLRNQRLSLANVDDESTLAVADFLTSLEDWGREG
ncbi:MAG: Rieske 2Fe-2S domain-containing protein [Archangium sp.]